MSTATDLETQIPSIRALARLLNRSHTTIVEWRHRWPFKPSPPWPLSQVPAMLEWSESEFDDERNTEQVEARERRAKLRVPGFTLTAEDIASERTPFKLRP